MYKKIAQGLSILAFGLALKYAFIRKVSKKVGETLVLVGIVVSLGCVIGA